MGANPGDSQAYAGLGYFPENPARPHLVRAASLLAPNDPNVLTARAALALDQSRLADAAADLVQLVEYYHHLTREPARTLARMIVQGHAALLQEHLKPGSHWLALVLATMVELRAPLAAASPLMARAVENGALPPDRTGNLIRILKSEGSWVDAYGLWLAQHRGRAAVLYNAGFDEPFESDGFDWEVTEERAGRAGASVATRSMPGRGQVLDLMFTGRSLPTPLVRQYVLLAPGRYRIAGQYMASKLRSDSGLAWAVLCSVGPAPQPAGKSTGLQDTDGQWRPFDFEVEVSDKCGPVASVQLETFAPYEATAGVRGRAYFDALSLQKLPP